MKTFEELENCWKGNRIKASKQTAAFDVDSLQKTIASQIKQERKKIFKYFWASYTWQLMIYTSLTYLIMHSWGDWQMVLLCIAGIMLYVPFTTVFIKKYKQMAEQRPRQFAHSLTESIQVQHVLLNDFFSFKRKFDWIGLPLTCFIITAIVFKLWVPGGWSNHIMGVAIVYVISLTAFLIAMVNENRKSFRTPLLQLQKVMDDLNSDRMN